MGECVYTLFEGKKEKGYCLRVYENRLALCCVGRKRDEEMKSIPFSSIATVLFKKKSSIIFTMKGNSDIFSDISDLPYKNSFPFHKKNNDLAQIIYQYIAGKIG